MVTKVFLIGHNWEISHIRPVRHWSDSKQGDWVKTRVWSERCQHPNSSQLLGPTEELLTLSHFISTYVNFKSFLPGGQSEVELSKYLILHFGGRQNFGLAFTYFGIWQNGTSLLVNLFGQTLIGPGGYIDTLVRLKHWNIVNQGWNIDTLFRIMFVGFTWHVRVISLDCREHWIVNAYHDYY